MGKLRRFVSLVTRVRNGLAALGLWLAVVILPLKIQQLPAALRWWAALLPSREVLLTGFSGVLVAYIIWIDIRPPVLEWLASRQRKKRYTKADRERIADAMQEAAVLLQERGKAITLALAEVQAAAGQYHNMDMPKVTARIETAMSLCRQMSAEFSSSGSIAQRNPSYANDFKYVLGADHIPTQELEIDLRELLQVLRIVDIVVKIGHQSDLYLMAMGLPGGPTLRLVNAAGRLERWADNSKTRALELRIKLLSET